MAFIFPSNPNIGDLVENPSSGQIFRWSGFAWSGDSANALLTASFAFTASYVLGGIVPSSSITDTASYAETSSYAFYAVSASYEIVHELSSSYADTASYVQNAQSSSYVLLEQIASNGNYGNDEAAAAAGIPIGGLYRNGNFVQIRIS